MLLKKIHGDPKIGDISRMGNRVASMKFVAGVLVTLMACVALLIPAGVSQAKGAISVAGVEFLEITEPEFITVTQPEFLEVTKFEFLGITEPEFIEPWVDPSDGIRKWGGQAKTLKQIMCGPSNGLATSESCLFVGSENDN